MTDFSVPALRFSISNDLKFDAERDLKDIDAANIPVHALNKVSQAFIFIYYNFRDNVMMIIHIFHGN